MRRWAQAAPDRPFRGRHCAGTAIARRATPPPAGHLLDPQLEDLVVARPEGLYCPPGDFYIDPWQPVARRAHHACARRPPAHRPRPLPGRRGRPPRGARAASAPSTCRRCPTARRSRIAACACRSIRPATCWARPRSGSSTAARCGSSPATTRPGPDPTCAPFEPVRCDVFITESTFGLPVFRWAPQQEVFDDDQRLVAGQRRRAGARPSSTRTRSARRSACWRGSTRASARSSCTAPSRR